MAHLVEIEGLSLEIDGNGILDGIDLSVEKGEFVAVVGPNGSGKTTLLKCLDMLHDDWRGSISLNGKELREFSRRELARTVAYVPQQLGTLPDYSVRTFIALSRYAWDGDDGAVERALTAVGMSEFADRSLNSLSGGELQKVSIASALAQETDVVLLDEPTAFLDPKYCQQIWNLLSDMKSKGGRTFIAVTHDLNSAASCADRLCGLKNGRLFASLPPSDFMDKALLDSLFDADFSLLKSEKPIAHLL